MKGAQVFGHVLALAAVAPCRTLHEPAVLVTERHRKAVDLGLGDDLHGLVRTQAQEPPDAIIELGNIFR